MEMGRWYCDVCRVPLIEEDGNFVCPSCGREQLSSDSTRRSCSRSYDDEATNTYGGGE